MILALNVRTARHLAYCPAGQAYSFRSGCPPSQAAPAMPAGLGEVPCWVEGMADEAAFLELVKSNRQSEPTPLECEVHEGAHQPAGMGGRCIEDGISAKKRGTIRREMQAAEAAEKVRNVTQVSDPNGRAVRLAELHASGCWIWPTLVARRLGADRTAEITRAQAARFEMCPSRPPWRIAMPSPR